jgi:hypothetical protein
MKNPGFAPAHYALSKPGFFFGKPEKAEAHMELADFFDGYAESRVIFDAVWAAAQALGPVALRVTKSQVALELEGRPFAWLWIPAKHLGRKAAPLVLTLSFRQPQPWSRCKEIYQAAPGRYTHHLELWRPEDVDEQALEWLQVAHQQVQEKPHDR